MPQVKIRISCWLSRGVEAESTDFEHMSASVPKDESLLEMVRRVAAVDDIFRRAIFDEKNREIQPNIVVILNGRIITPYECCKATLKGGDEVIFLPMLYEG